MKSLVWLTEHVLQDCGTRCGADPSRDILEVTRRTKDEGESFLTITLPAFCQGFERGLATGRLIKLHTPAFRWHRRGLPEFLRGFLGRIFGPDGLVLPDPCVESIACVRQICLLHKKVLRDCTDTRLEKALNAYRKCEYEVKAWTASHDEAVLNHFARVAAVVWSDVLRGAPCGDPRQDLHPHHGPGATRERIHGNAKYVFKRWHARLEEYFPYTEYGLASVLNDGMASIEDVDFVEPGGEDPVRVVFVPKTQKTPRVIAIEPVCMQFVQQGLLRWLVPQVERGTFTKGRVNFTDQSINAKLALESSKSGSLATIDLSEASDRVSSLLVSRMLDVAPLFKELVFACRSTRAELPDGEILTLEKFASMGSALCFPMEAMAFFCAIVSMRLMHANKPVTSRNVARAAKRLYVYGDDIIVPADEAPSVCVHLGLLGLKVNDHKSFWTGKFRESCGMDAYAGEEVTPTYARYDSPTCRRDVDALVSWTAMANQFYLKGFWRTAKALRSHVEGILGTLPFLGDQAQGLHWVNYSKSTQYRRWNETLMRFEVRTWVNSPVYRSDPIDGDAALLKCFSVIGGKTSMALDHLLRSVARGRQALKARWVPSV